MDALHNDIIQCLQACSFYPGSFDKRFVRDMASLGSYDLLTPKQAALLEQMAWRYRRQIGSELVSPPQRPRSAEDEAKLAAWNEGKPI